MTDQSSHLLVQASQLHKQYDQGSVLALNDVSIEIERGSFVAITGASGSGKSTLLHVLGTLDSPDSGSLRFNGKDIKDVTRLDRFRAEEIGFVFQLHYLLPHLSLLENVMLPLAVIPGLSRGDAKQRAVEALERVGLGHRVKHLPNRISGGERQRGAIARAIVARPPLLLADEPTGNVDSVTEAKILDLFEELRASLDVTLVVVTHNDAVAERAQIVRQMRDGVLLPLDKVEANA